ncbi:MAG: CTAG/PCC1 family protein [Candidatus Marsarchaeota archaeon]|nr:CTAG/PCC1 family protein [Candidatus Marsarchaeota archaeon]
MKISISAADATALRASVNSVLRDVQTIDGATALFHKSQKK